jgi:virginiamycin A acetyltransferase
MKAVVKSVCYALALLLVFPWALGEILVRKAMGRDVWFVTHAEFLSLLPGKMGYFVRNAYYHLTLRRCPLSCCFHFGTIFTHSEAEVGERVCTGFHCIIGMATIGDDTMFAQGVQVLSGKFQHGISDTNVAFQEQPGVLTRIHIGRNCWVGTNAIIMADVGKNSVVAAGTIVTRAVPDDKLAMGNPARIMSKELSAAAKGSPPESPVDEEKVTPVLKGES